MGRSIEDSLAAVRRLTGLELPVVEEAAEVGALIGRRFWTALCRGGYQGGAYLLDALARSAGAGE